MPCPIQSHYHQPWPTSGEKFLTIESCESHCGWCAFKMSKAGAANNLRKHAQRHITHDESLKGITILSSRAGRPRVRQNPDSRPSLQQPPESAVQHHDGESLRALDNVDDESRPLYSDLLLERNALQSRVLLLEELLVSNSITIPEKHPSPGPTLQPVQQLIRFANRLHSQCEELDTRSTSFQNMHERHDKSINAILTFLAVFYERSLESQEDQPD